MSQREFGRCTHISAALLNEILSGKQQLTIKCAKKIEAALGIGADWLLYGDEDAKEYPLSDAMIKYVRPEKGVMFSRWKSCPIRC